MANAVGVPNPGVDRWAQDLLPPMLRAGVNVVASLWGVDGEGVVAAAELMARYRGPIAWELNLSCPNSGHPGRPVSHDPQTAAEVCRSVRALAPDEVSVWAKLSPDAPDVLEVGEACHAAGADALTVSNTYPRSPEMIDDDSRLGGGAGGMSGAVLRQYVRPLIEKFSTTYPHIPLIACGGVLGSADALDYLALGARAVQVGTANLYDPRACHKIARGVVSSLKRDGP
jgi:dihydroorotate dehydrogenase (NAD+) catalytic subunit